MNLNNLQERILAPFAAETVKSLKTLAQMEAQAGAGFEDELEKFRFKGYAIATEVSGTIPGKVLLHLYPETALELGNRVLTSMLGEPSKEAAMSDDIQDALAEWGNTLIGLATRTLEESDIGVTFTSPFFVRDTEHMNDLMHKVSEIVSIPIHTEGAGRFYFNYLLHSKTGAA
jgi:CheY-specific phosphatase CheX